MGGRAGHWPTIGLTAALLVILGKMVLVIVTLQPGRGEEEVMVLGRLRDLVIQQGELVIQQREQDTFHIIDKKAVKLLIRPSRACRHRFVILVTSMASHTSQRSRLRQQFLSQPDALVIFLLGASEEDQIQVHREGRLYGDILQASVWEAYKTIIYKIILGFTWSSAWCGPTTEFVIKTDDNVLLDFPRLARALGEVDTKDSILCPSVMRNLKVWRHNDSAIMGKWAVERAAWSSQTYLPHCNGWLYATTPKVALALSLAATSLPRAVPSSRGPLDDTVITGYLRHQLGWVQVKALDGGLYGWAWDNILSSCSFLGFLKNVFLNQFVLEKSTPELQYVNSPKFALCAMLETVLFESLKPLGLHMELAKYCHRSSREDS